MEKKCSKCKIVKPLEEFCKSSHRKDGHSPHCKACHRGYYKKRKVAQPLHPGDSKKCSKCGEIKPVEQFDKSPRYRTGYVSHCKDCRRAMSRNWKARNQERVKRYQQEWFTAHPGYAKTKRQQTPEWKRKIYRQRKRIKSRTPEGRAYGRHVQAIRRAAVKTGDVTPEYLFDLLETAEYCHYCHRPFSDELPAHIDHVKPLSKFGTHTKDNIVLSCKSCNSTKRDKYPYQK